MNPIVSATRVQIVTQLAEISWIQRTLKLLSDVDTLRQTQL